jgi:NAD(P)-dependent dehydrogenase (short-subunit alcohol dehydrogenase family)
MSIRNKVALITGGSKGIGYGIAEEMVKAGINVAISSRSIENAKDAAQRLQKLAAVEVLPVEADVKSWEDQQKMVDHVITKLGAIDIVVANAGVGHFATIDDLSIEDWNDVIDTNLTGAFYTIKSSLEALTKSKGYFITISSLAGTNFFPMGSAYNASKFGLVGFTQAVMLDVRKRGIKVTTIMPGSVATYFNNHTPSPEDAWKIQPEDIGQMVIDLLEMPERTLPSKIEVRPSVPPSK